MEYQALEKTDNSYQFSSAFLSTLSTYWKMNQSTMALPIKNAFFKTISANKQASSKFFQWKVSNNSFLPWAMTLLLIFDPIVLS